MTSAAEADLPQEIGAHLIGGETLVWWGRPVQGIFLRGIDWFLIPFSLLWGGFAVVWEIIVLRQDGPSLFALFGLPFVLIGLFLAFGRFALDSWLRGRTMYALTDRRVLIVRAAPWPGLQSVNLDRLPGASLRKAANGRGTIRFGPSGPLLGPMNYGGFGGWVAALDSTPQFLDIDDVDRVFAAVQERSLGRA